MPTMSLPSLTRGASVLNRLGQQAKQLGPDLFSPYQATNPVKTAAASSSFAIPSAPGVSWNDTGGPSLSSGNLFNTSMPQFKLPSLGGAFGSTSGTTTPSSGGGSAGSLGGEYAFLDQYDQYFQEASAATGIPVNTLKAIAAVERGWEGTSVAGAMGIMQVMPFWGQDFGLDLSDPRQNILAGAKVLASNLQQYGSMDMAIRGYLGFGQDAYGTTDQAYLQRVRDFETQLNQSGGSFGTQPINGMWGGNPVGNSFVQQAMQYVGVDYNWGAIPGANENPWQTGWDCSGFTYFMNQKYGDKSLPMGSHYQYDYAIRTGKLFSDLNQLQPGDLVFIDTGWQGGAGAELNRAGHVAIYIGNGQIIHAANPSQGTIVSPLSGYSGILGAMHQSTSGGYGGYSPAASQASQGNSLLDAIMGFYRG